MVASAMALRDYAMKRAKIAVRVTRSDNLPYTVVVERRQILQVLLNLLLNAEQALAGSEGGELVAGLERGRSEVIMSVTDNGPGVAPAIRQRVNDGTWADTIGATACGVGLGVASRIVERHGGRLVIEDGTPRGARVVVSLPTA